MKRRERERREGGERCKVIGDRAHGGPDQML